MLRFSCAQMDISAHHPQICRCCAKPAKLHPTCIAIPKFGFCPKICCLIMIKILLHRHAMMLCIKSICNVLLI